MGTDSFRFKQFTVFQRQSAMKVGTDGVLLGSWAGLDGHEQRILDVGTGTGLIALMMAQRSAGAHIDAVEIEPLAAAEAADNVAQSPWPDRITVVMDSFQNFAACANAKYDLIVSNPPYFNGTYKSPAVERTAARHMALLSNDDLIDGVVRLLEPEKGRFAAIFPYESGAVFIAKAALHGLYCTKVLNIYPKQGKYVKRIAMEFSMQRALLVEQNMAIQDDERYSADYQHLTQDFYLKF